MDGKRREEREQAEHEPKEEKAHGYAPRQQSSGYKEFVKLRQAHEQAEKKRKEKAESKSKDEKAKESEKKQRAQDQEPGKPKDLYGILDVVPSVTQAELVKAARKKRVETHPDRFSGHNISPAEVDEIIERSKTVGHAADILCDPVARVKYDSEVAAWKQKQRVPSPGVPEGNFGVPEGMSYFGSNSPPWSDDRPKHQSSGYNAYPESRDQPSSWEARADRPKHQSARFNPGTESRKASSNRKEDSAKSSYRHPNKYYGSSSSNDDASDDSSPRSLHRARERTHSSAHSRPIPHPPRQAPRKSFGAADEPRFAHAAYSRPAGRSAGFSGPQASAQQPSSRGQRYQEPSSSARFGDYRDYLDDVAEDLDELDLGLPKPARAAFASRGHRDEREVREGYRADSRDHSPIQFPGDL